ERIGEVAVMRALGFGREAVAGLLFGECAVIGIAGGAAGAGLAWWMFSRGVTLGPVLNGNGALYVMPEQAIVGLVAAVFVTLASGLIPIAGALRIAPALAFRKGVRKKSGRENGRKRSRAAARAHPREKRALWG